MGKNEPIRNPDCTLCGLRNSAKTICIIGQGPTPCKIMIVGEAPGFREDEVGKPFQGKTGKLLDEMLKEAGLSRDEVYLTNIMHCHPPDNRAPKAKEVKACLGYLQQEIKLVNPQFIILLGAVAVKAIFNKAGVNKLRGSSKEKDGITYMITLHPAALFRQPLQIPVVKADFARFAKQIAGKLDTENSLNYTLVDSIAKLRICNKSLLVSPHISYDTETTSLNWKDPREKLGVLGFGVEDHQWVVPFHHPESPWDGNDALHRKIMASLLISIEDNKKLIAQNGKYDNKFLKFRYGACPNQTFDTMLASYLLNENSPNGLKEMSRVYYDASDYELDLETKKVYDYPLKTVAKYNAFDVYYTLKLYHLFKEKLKEDPALLRVYKYLLMPASRALEDAEMEGVYIDPVAYQASMKKNDAEIISTKALLDSLVKEPINWNSTQQVAKLLFEKLKLPVLEYTEKGAPSTSGETVLPRLREYHPVVDALLEHRDRVKLGQFITGWGEHIENNRIHSSFLLHGTVTGRLSNRNPNLQQTPRNPLLRALITAPPGWIMIEADYSQAELRIAAMMADETNMKQCFSNGIDIHKRTAASVAKVLLEAVTKDMRKKAKAVNFGFVYGMGWRKFKDYARDKYDVIMTEEEAQEAREIFFQLYPGLTPWHERQRRLVRKYKQVRSMMGRLRRLPEVDSPERGISAEAERQAVNSPVQVLASDFNLYSFVRMHKELSWEKVRPVALIHDAILTLVRIDSLVEMLPKMVHIMTDMKTIERVFHTRITVPIEIEMKAGAWGKGVVVYDEEKGLNMEVIKGLQLRT